MSPSAAGAGVELQYASHGEGRPVLAVHGIGGSSSLLAAQLGAVAERARLITYDRRGYGASEAPDPYLATTVIEQSEDAVKLLEALDGCPAVLVGFGFGALIALDLSLRHQQVVSAALLVDPPLYAFDAGSTRELADQRGAIETALLASSQRDAIAALLGTGASAELQANAQANSGACFADYGGLASLELTRGQLRACELPISIVLTRDASAPLQRIAAEIGGLLANSLLWADDDIVVAVTALLD